jgi:hypothetical protein
MEEGKLIVEHVRIEDRLVDILTKPSGSKL